jgi:hypothetical protein
MKSNVLFLFIFLKLSTLCFSQSGNLISEGDFSSLKPWTANENLKMRGKVSLLPDEQGVTIFNPVIDLDGSLYQDIQLKNQEWLRYSVRIRRGNLMMRASLGFIAYDKDGTVLNILTPTKVQGSGWKSYQGYLNIPAETRKVRVLLTVLDGTCSYANLEVTAGERPEEIVIPQNISEGRGVSVKTSIVNRPFWELYSDDLDRDGLPELIGCDVDGIVTVRNPGKPAFFTYAPGALVYQFESVDLNRDGRKEIILSMVDPKIKIRAIDIEGKTVAVFEGPSSHERIVAGDMDGDGFPEVITSKNNGIAGSGIAGGVVLYDHLGKQLWQKDEDLREFKIADVHPAKGQELIVGGPGMNFRIYNKSGELLGNISLEGGILDHFTVSDVNADGKNEIISTYSSSGRTAVICSDGSNILWKTITPRQMAGGSNAGTSLVVADFDAKLNGFETAIIATHNFYLFDAKGNLIYNDGEEDNQAYWERWADRGINSLDIAWWNEKDPRLFLSSSRFRHPACYELRYGDRDDLKTYLLPDQEQHLEGIYETLKKQSVQDKNSEEKIKIFMALTSFARVPEEILIDYRKTLDQFETENLEYLVMYEASDLYGHERGYKLTTDQIVERAELFEKTGIPFGYFATHGGQVWTSEEAIRRSKEVAPNMFRFLYIAENLEKLYSPQYKDVLEWTNKTLNFCAAHNMKMIFKEKHDVWGLLPSDPEVSNILFSDKHKEVTVPLWSTNQPFQPEIQLGGMLGLKNAGMCNEFGMSTQYWNWHEWGRFPRGIRDVSAAFVCPSDIILRLELMGIALGSTWIHIEGGQTYFESDITRGLAPLAKRHRDLSYEMIRKNILIPGAMPVNINETAVIREFHPEMHKGKEDMQRIAYPYYQRNKEELRMGFIPARYLFETYDSDAFPKIAYALDWNAITCFPETPNGWVQVLPPAASISEEMKMIYTDGERIHMDGNRISSKKAAPLVENMLNAGTGHFPLEAPGTCLIIQKDENKSGVFTAIMLDPGYLAPSGVETVVRAETNILDATDMMTGEKMEFKGNSCPVIIEPGAFRVIRFEFAE